MLDIIKPIEKEFSAVRENLSTALHSSYSQLGEVTRYLVTPHGKMLRPALTLLMAKHYGKITERTIAVASMIEMVHYATLVHDDVIDEAYTRQRGLTLGALLRSRSAVLVGDYIFSKGLSQASKAGAYQELDVVIAAIESLVEGELLQAQNVEHYNPAIESYYEVARLKTAALLSAAAMGGALSVGASDTEIQKAKKFGEILGILFQIQDDVLDYLPKELTGKEPYNDIKERKMTLPLLLAIQEGGSSIIKHIRVGNIEKVANFVEKHEGIRRTEEHIERLTKEALAMVEDMQPSDAQKALYRAVEFAGARKY